jgi:putative ABC transport system substrate-binding protein
VLLPWSPPSAPDWKGTSGFLQELRTLGWREGENLTVEYRWAAGQFYRGSDLAAELVRLPAEVIVAQSRSLIQAAQHATTTIPIVMISGDDPVEEGLIASLARPGSNLTGVDYSFVPELGGKLLALLNEAVPAVTRVAVLVQPTVPGTGDT